MENEILREAITRIAGRGSEALVDILTEKPTFDEFKVAEKLGINVNQLRNILYKLHAYDLVSFVKKKDKRKGWFIYYWTLNKRNIVKQLHAFYYRELHELKNILKSREEKNYFVCPRGHIELAEEAALEQNFECTECNELLVLKDRESEIKKIKRSIVDIESKVKQLEESISAMEAKPRKIEAKRKKSKKVKKVRKIKKTKGKAKEKAKKKAKKEQKKGKPRKVKSKIKSKIKSKAKVKKKTEKKTKK